MSWSCHMAQEICVSLRSSGHSEIQLSLHSNVLCSEEPNISRHHLRLPRARAIFRPSTIFKVLCRSSRSGGDEPGAEAIGGWEP